MSLLASESAAKSFLSGPRATLGPSNQPSSRLDYILEHNAKNLGRLAQITESLRRKKNAVFGAYPEKETGVDARPTPNGQIGVLAQQVEDFSSVLDILGAVTEEIAGI